MDNTSHDHQDDSSALEGKKQSHLEETINHGQHMGQNLSNISPQGENFTQTQSPWSIRKCHASYIDLDWTQTFILSCDHMLLQGVCGSIQSLRCIRSAAGRTQSPRMEHRRRRTEEREMDFHSEVVLNLLLLRCGKQRSTDDSWGEWAMNLTRGLTKGWASYMVLWIHLYLRGCELEALNMWNLTNCFVVSRTSKEWTARNRPTEDGSHSSGVPKKRRAENEVVML